MCAECYENTVIPMEDLMKTVLADNENVWMGTYALESGNRLRCHECGQFNPNDWEEKDNIIGSVYFEIDEPDPDNPGKWICDVDGGEAGFTDKTTFVDFCSLLMSWHCEKVIQKLSDDDDEDQ